jgi:hypothetical protein
MSLKKKVTNLSYSDITKTFLAILKKLSKSGYSVVESNLEKLQKLVTRITLCRKDVSMIQ